MNEAALKERIKAIAKQKSMQFNEVWKQLLLERFLSRVSISNYQSKFIFKGGLLLAQYIELGRETMDADFLLRKIKNEASTLEAAAKEIASLDTHDGFLFTWSGLDVLDQPHMEYQGFRIKLSASFGKMQDIIQIDIGTGDQVDAKKETLEPFLYKGKPIFSGEISLYVYPVETILAEKLETIVSKSTFNSRMKDYHDVILIIRENGLIDTEKVRQSILSTFKHRGTGINFPIMFNLEKMGDLEKIWLEHLKGLGDFQTKLKLPPSISEAMNEINRWLETHDIQ